MLIMPEIGTVMNLTELEKEKAIKEQKGETAESNIDLKSLVDRIALHEKHPELDDQYNRALLKLFLREVIFHFSVVSKKKKNGGNFGRLLLKDH
ncbi:MAG: hypothetical protein LRY30_00060 [Gammaproteobacteria bacterium]|nr:hypothetical protein [Gammaproteobacteria bacterium]